MTRFIIVSPLCRVFWQCLNIVTTSIEANFNENKDINFECVVKLTFDSANINIC